jgi:hypothetical protein
MNAVKPGSRRDVSLALHSDFLSRQDRTEITQFRTSSVRAISGSVDGMALK